MKHTKGRNEIVDSELILLCKHCGKSIEQAELIGLSLICPLCGKPQNGQPHMEV